MISMENSTSENAGGIFFDKWSKQWR